jgi:hypothetical protein
MFHLFREKRHGGGRVSGCKSLSGGRHRAAVFASTWIREMGHGDMEGGVSMWCLNLISSMLSSTTSVLTLVGVVLKVSVTAIGMVDKTTGAHQAARDALRNLRRALQNLNKRTSNIKAILRIFISDPKDKEVKKLLGL